MDRDLDALIGPPVNPAAVDVVEADGERPADADLPEVPRVSGRGADGPANWLQAEPRS